MKIKKKKTVVKKTLSVNQKDRRNFFLVIGIILLANLLIFFTAFPKLDDIAAAGSKPDSASRASFLKLTVIVVTDIILFVSLSMALARNPFKRKKR